MDKIITLFVSFFILSSCVSQKNNTILQGKEGKRLDSLLTPYVKELRDYTDNNAGLAIGVTKGDRIVYARVFGYANLEKEKATDLNTIFHIASLSKPFAAAAIVKLVEQGKLNLDDYIINHIPEFEMKGNDFKQITIKQVLTHTSGIPGHVSSGDWENPVFGIKALDKNLEDAKEVELEFVPGTEYSYSNSAFDILGVLISRVSGKPFEKYVTEQILIPAGMTQSYFIKPKDSLPENWAESYSYGIETQAWTPFPYTENYFPSSGLHTTILDMCNWGMLYVNNGKYMSKEVFNGEVFPLLTNPYFDTPWGDKIGLSWFLKTYMERPIIMHQDTDTGFESIIYVYPKDSVSITILANRDFSRTGRIINATSEILFGENAKDYNVSAKYKFTDAYKKYGITAAAQLWNELKIDTTDIYFTNDEDILTTGAVLENGKKWQESKEILEYYISLDSKSTYAWRLLGNANLNLGDKEAAKTCYQQTLKINPNYEKGKEALNDLNKMKN